MGFHCSDGLQLTQANKTSAILLVVKVSSMQLWPVLVYRYMIRPFQFIQDLSFFFLMYFRIHSKQKCIVIDLIVNSLFLAFFLKNGLLAFVFIFKKFIFIFNTDFIVVKSYQ